ncbi:MAG: hypothetical protein JSS22_18540 [Proteobacteria bacterium]|nr:hypothetical protein [Pseudomonadota bacterium]
MTVRIRRHWGLIALAAILLLAGAIVDGRSALAAYLVTWVALSAIPIGALGVLMVSYVVRRDWTEALHPVLAAAAATISVAGILFIPILILIAHIYPAASDPASLPAFKAIYLTPWFFAARAVAYFIIWTVLGWWLRAAWPDRERMMRAASAGLIVYALTVSLAGVDWLESLEPDFHSSIYGLLYLCFAMLDGVAFAIAAGLFLRRPLSGINGYSALLLSTILLWGYLHGMQYIVIWSGNIPAEVVWYIKRSANGWQFVLAVLAFGQFVFPFFALLNSRVRRDRRWLLGLCALTLIMRGIEAAVLILPAIPGVAMLPTVLMLAPALVLVGCLMLAAFEIARARDGRLFSFAIVGRRGTVPRSTR